MGSQVVNDKDVKGVHFAVLAPRAVKVELIGDFNDWDGTKNQMFARWDESGIWECFIPDIGIGSLYKFKVFGEHDNHIGEKSDPFAFHNEILPKTASVVWEFDYKWNDQDWMDARAKSNHFQEPMSVYELHLGSWKKSKGLSLSYKSIASELIAYVLEMGYTHVEFLPLTEHPYYPSWGYLSTGFFAPTSRYGDPHELMYLIDHLHQAGIGVFVDWVPGHFPNDDFGLANFDGTCLFEHPDPTKGYHPDWNSLIFNYERGEIKSFLLSSAHFWLEKYHIDGLRVDAVTSMIHLDYSRDHGEWETNVIGDNRYIAAIDFIKDLNTSINTTFPDVIVMAEESTAFPGVTDSRFNGGLQFGYKWMMGWMNDVLRFFARDPIFRKHHRNEISFSFHYAYDEKFLLPFSHDEVVHGKSSMVYKMHGDEWEKFANLRLLYGLMFAHPGHKLLFMGNDFAQTNEWNFNEELSWNLLQYEQHQGIQNLIKSLNNLYRYEESLYLNSFDPSGFEWIDFSHPDYDVFAFLRKSNDEQVLVICNFNPVLIENYKIGVPDFDEWEEIFNTDMKVYWGKGNRNSGKIKAIKMDLHDRKKAISLNIAPLAMHILKPVHKRKPQKKHSKIKNT